MAKIWTTDRLEFRRLKNELGIPAAHALGLLETLNVYSHKNTQDRLGVRFKPGDIPELCEWQSGPDLEAALLRHGWILERDGEYLIADYGTDLPDFVRKRITRQSTPENDCPDNVRKMSGQCPPREEKDREEKDKEADPIRTDAPEESVSAVGVLAHTSPESVPKKEGTAFEGEAVQAGAVAAAVLGGLTHTVNQTAAEKRAALVRRIMGLTREPPEYADWWEDVIKSTAKINSMDVLLDACRYAAMCADPAQRETKGLGELHNPGAYIAGKCRDVLKSHGMSLPPPPKPSAVGAADYENDDCPF